ncbi:MAG: twin-arginine translocation signal domain-containing protein, partial [Bacillota bacterium]
MSAEKKSGGISRRNFLKGMSTTIAGSYVLVPGISEAAEKIGNKVQENISKEKLSLKVNGKQIQ